MAFCDFVVKYNPDTDSQEELTKRILYSVIIKRLKAKKPAVIFIGGDSGEGKSLSSIRLLELLCEVQGLALKDFFNDINVYTPIEYPTKLDNLLYDKRLKKVNLIVIHEARELVKAKNWQKFLTQAIADVNAMSRSIKRLCTIIISQFIRDITTDIRYTLNYYMVVRRPKGRPARVYINVMWKDDRDLEKPKLRKRKLSGYLVSPTGKYRRFVPRYLELRKPDKELVKIFEKSDKEAKTEIIRSKLNRLIEEMRQEMDTDNNKIDLMVDFYSKNTSNLQLITRKYKGSLRVNSNFKDMHDITNEEARKFEKLLNERLKKKGEIKDDGTPEESKRL